MRGGPLFRFFGGYRELLLNGQRKSIWKWHSIKSLLTVLNKVKIESFSLYPDQTALYLHAHCLRDF